MKNLLRLAGLTTGLVLGCRQREAALAPAAGATDGRAGMPQFNPRVHWTLPAMPDVIASYKTSTRRVSISSGQSCLKTPEANAPRRLLSFARQQRRFR